ncbi:hypothetical protein C2869_06340 [Saccharobesus litoralis]|uniref:HTH araC/xylS-type domain-containing protein n=1 Tax=Saccharobesus litoralis TaxID=2172099 RepID=A0A2S0VPG8_9ALTE|nr:helix-turn-helix domain-containing protein [Saccharobesus litoralis]AWB66082.1 hypothetical protein C2869_06340 [Saccharobesus litoralis]
MSTLYKPFQPTLTLAGLTKFGLALNICASSPGLKNTVSAFVQVSTQQATLYRVLPDGTQAIYLSKSGALFSGAQIKVCDVPMYMYADEEYFGVWFCPGVLRRLFNIDLSEVAGQLVPADDLLNSELQRLTYQVYDKATFAERVTLFESWLMTRFHQVLNPKLEHALSLILYLPERPSTFEKVSIIAEKIGVTSRHLNRLFLQNIGLNTKQFINVIRAQQACRTLFNQSKAKHLIDNELGYYDQAHCINEFKTYFGATPINLVNQYTV